MSAVFKSALRLFSGTAKREQLASELSDKLYSGRADKATMSELGIELVKPGADPSAPGAEVTVPAKSAKPGDISPTPERGARTASSQPAAISPNSLPVASLSVKNSAPPGTPPLGGLSSNVRTNLLARIWSRSKAYSVELSMIPVVFLGMILVQRVKGRRSSADEFLPATLGLQTPAESEKYDMKHRVHSLGAEEFEMLVALIYQRQGYRVSMPAGLSGGRGGDFTLLRKSERILVQCKKLSLEHRVPVERVRELHEAMIAAGLTRGMYVVSCGFTWDARNFAKARGITLINARTLDELLTAAREKPDEDLLAVSQWGPKLMSKVQMTPPHCPACEAAMNEISASDGSVWVCCQRPECRGRRTARKHQKPVPALAAS